MVSNPRKTIWRNKRLHTWHQKPWWKSLFVVSAYVRQTWSFCLSACPYRWWKKSGKPIDRYSRSSHDLRPFFTSQVVTTRLRAQIGPSSDIKVGLSPFPGCQSPPGWHYMFRCGDSYLNLHLLLLLGRGTIYAPYGCFLQPFIYMYDAGYQ